MEWRRWQGKKPNVLGQVTRRLWRRLSWCVCSRVALLRSEWPFTEQLLTAQDEGDGVDELAADYTVDHYAESDGEEGDAAEALF